MDGPIHAATAQKGAIGGVHDDVDVLASDVPGNGENGASEKTVHRKCCGLRGRSSRTPSALIRADELGLREHMRFDACFEMLLARRRRADRRDVQRVDAMRITMSSRRRAGAAVADRAEIGGSLGGGPAVGTRV